MIGAVLIVLGIVNLFFVTWADSYQPNTFIEYERAVFVVDDIPQDKLLLRGISCIGDKVFEAEIFVVGGRSTHFWGAELEQGCPHLSHPTE